MLAWRWQGGRLQADNRSPAPSSAPGMAVLAPGAMLMTARDSTVGQDGIIAGRFAVGRVVDPVPGADMMARRTASARFVAWPLIPCAACERCRQGLASHCPQRTILGRDASGVYAQSCVLPTRQLAEVPEHVSDDAAAIAGPLAMAIHATQVGGADNRGLITVLGDGLEALLAAQVLAAINPSVRLLGRDEARLTLCERWGIKHRHQDDAGRRADQDLVIDASGDGSHLALSLELVRPRGRVVVMATELGSSGAPPPALAQPADIATGLLRQEARLLGARGGSLADAVTMLARGTIDVSGLITARRRLAEAGQAMAECLRPGHVATLIEP